MSQRNKTGFDADETVKFIKSLGASIRITGESTSELGGFIASSFDIEISRLRPKELSAVLNRLRKDPVVAKKLAKKKVKIKKTKTKGKK